MESIFAGIHGAARKGNLIDRYWDGWVTPWFSLEVIGDETGIHFYIWTMEFFKRMFEAQIYAQYPSSEVRVVEDYTKSLPAVLPDKDWNLWGTELTLAKDEFMPIRTWPLFEHPLTQELKDPLAIILEQMGRMRPGEVFWFQILCVPFSQEWREAGIKYISKIYGIKETVKKSKWEEALASTLWLPHQVLEETTGANLLGLLGVNSGDQAKPKDEDMWKAFKITLQEKTQVEGIANKVSKLGFKTKIRMVYAAKKSVYSKGTRVPFVKGMLLQFSHQDC